MISASLRFEGFDSGSWTNLLSLLLPGVVERLEVDAPASDAPEVDHPGGLGAPRGSLVIVHDGQGRVLKAFHSTRGRVPSLQYDGPEQLPALCRQYAARRAFVLREGVLEELSERLALRLGQGDDYLTQWLTLMRAVREFEDAGLVRMWPAARAHLPIPSPGTVRRALDLVLPDDEAMLVMLWQRSGPWTAVVLRRHAGVIDLVAGPDLIARWTGPLGGDWRRDYRVVVDAVEHAVAPVHLGIFSEASTMRGLLRDPDPGTWAHAVAVRDVIFYPAPPYVNVALGADALRALARNSARLLGGMDLLGAFGPVGQYVRNRVSEVASVSSTLGFNPLRALAEALRRRELSEADPERAPSPSLEDPAAGPLSPDEPSPGSEDPR